MVDFSKIYSKPNNAPWTFSKIPKEIVELVKKKELTKEV